MAKNRMRPIHPGEVLREEYMVPLRLSATALARALGVTSTRINDIVRERRRITADTALRLARYLRTDDLRLIDRISQAYNLSEKSVSSLDILLIESTMTRYR